MPKAFSDQEKEFIRLKEEQEGYVAGKVAEFKIYLSAELNVLDAVRSYYIIYDYLREFMVRIERFLQQETPNVSRALYSEDVEKKFALYRVEYLTAVSAVLKEHSGCYGPMEGSVPEDIGKLLEVLSREVLQSIIK